MKRRELLALLAAAAAAPMVHAAGTQGPGAAKAAGPRPVLVEIWRNPGCGCCEGWTQHLQKNGFATKVTMVDDPTPVRSAAGIPPEFASCHTAKVEGYAIEGHVPASDIRKLLAERPKARGLASPGMPAAAPGMDIPNGPTYQVFLIAQDGSSRLYARHDGA